MPHKIHLSRDHEAFVENLVASERYHGASDVIGHALELLEDYEAARAARIVKFESQVAEGLADLDAGRSVPAADVFRELRAKIAAREAKPDAAE